jgi:hypothetical protein
MINKSTNYILLIGLLFIGFACKTKDDLEAFKEADYKLEHIEQVNVNGIDLLNKRRPEDFSFRDAALLFSAFSDNKLKATSTVGLNVDLKDGDTERIMTITQLKWQLLLNEEKTLSGVIDERVELKHGLNRLTLSSPLAFTQDKDGNNLNKLLKLAMLLNQKDTDKPKVTLQIKPTILTSVGPLELPTFINIK